MKNERRDSGAGEIVKAVGCDPDRIFDGYYGRVEMGNFLDKLQCRKDGEE